MIGREREPLSLPASGEPKALADAAGVARRPVGVEEEPQNKSVCLFLSCGCLVCNFRNGGETPPPQLER